MGDYPLLYFLPPIAMEHFSYLPRCHVARERQWRWRTVIASAAGFATLLSAGPASAALTSYTDVESGAWYEQSAANLLSSGALDASQVRLRPNDLSTRAEVFKMLVDLNDRVLEYPAVSSFSDVPRTAWYFPYIEAAAKAGWIRGDGNCYGQGMAKCTARPNDRVNRAEMSILMQRAFGLSYLNAAPRFPDVQTNQWYFTPIQTAADHCILQGDANTGLARPAAFMNRAEMVVMFDRADQDLKYGEDCGVQPEPMGSITGVSVVSADTVRVTFNVDLDPNREDDMDRYMLERSSNGVNVDIVDLNVINARTVELTLDTDLSAGVSYVLEVKDMRTHAGMVFSDTQTFTSAEGTETSIESVTVRSNGMLRVQFSTNVTASRADDVVRYSLMKTSNSANMVINGVTIIDDRTVDLDLGTTLASQTSYRLSVEDLTDENGTVFSDDFTFTTSQPSNLSLQSVTTLSPTRLQLQFNGALDETSAENESNYRVRDVSGELGVGTATLTSSNTVELVLDGTLQNQQSYTVTVTGIEGVSGTTFTGTGGVVLGTSSVLFRSTLNGSKEVPSVSTSSTGSGSFTLTANGLQYDIMLSTISGSMITGAHFHRGATGINGPVVETLSFTNLRATGTWTNLTAQERDDILDGRIYVNVHTNANPNGEIRGQVERQ